MNQFKRKLTAYTAMLAFLSLSSAVAYADIVTNPGAESLGKINGDFQASGNRLDINNTTNKAGTVAQFDWKNFNVDRGNHVNFGFSGLSQTIVNRVLGGQTSKILGRMTSSCIGNGACSSYNETGKVLLINPAGVMFGQGSQVDINSFTVSTFDMKGAKNLQGMSASQKADYEANVLNKASALHNTITIGGKTYKQGEVTLDSNYTDAFEAAGLSNADQMIQDSKVELNGATFTHFAKDANNDFDFSQEASRNTNKSVAIVANKIDYKDSAIRTGLNYNYIATKDNGAKVPYSYSNVKLITADGVTFNYLTNGYIDGHSIAAEDAHPELARTITMDNAGLIAQDPANAAIVSGSIDIEQRSKVANGNEPSVKIRDTIIRGMKLVDRENGDIAITASQDIDIDHSRFETHNTRVADSEGVYHTTTDRHGGEVYIRSDKDVNVDKTTIITSGSEGNVAYAENSGATRILAGNNATVQNSKIVSDGHTQIKAGNKTTVNNSLVQAYNTTDTTTQKDVTIVGANGVDIHNADLHSKGNTNILAIDEETGKYTGDITITGDDTKSIAQNDANPPLVEAKKALNIKGKNTTIDNVTLAYNESEGLNFYDAGKTGADYTNNVTIKNDTAFSPITTNTTGVEKIANDVNIETNGNLTFDNANAQRAQYSLKLKRKDSSGNSGYDIDPSNKMDDDGSIDAISYQTKSNPARRDAVNLNATSTNGNVTVTNGSNLNATNNTTITAAKGNYVQDKASTVSAGNNVSITAKAATVKESSKVKAENDATIVATTNNVNIENSTVEAIRNNATVRADKGAATVKNSRVEAANDATVKGSGNVTVDNSSVIAGSDKNGFDGTKDANDKIGTATVQSTNGSVYVKNNSTVTSQDKDVVIASKNGINFGLKGADGVNIDNSSKIQAENNVTIKSDAGNITAEKTEMPKIKYGNRLKLDAGKSNIITSKDSLKSVNVDYVAGESNRIYTTGDSQFVNSTLESPHNFIESGKDVILNNTEIKQATTNAKDTVTEIFANGNVTTYNVTGENLGAKDAGNYHSYPQDVDTNRVAKGDKTVPQYVKGLDSTELKVNQTKLKVTTDTVKDPANPDNGSITLVLNGADNKNAGVELTARNVDELKKDPTTGMFKQGYYKTGDPLWDGEGKEGPDLEAAIAPTQGPEIVLDSADGPIAIKDLYSDKLTLNPDKVIADGDATITIKDQGGFNLDPDTEYDPDGPDRFSYDRNYESQVIDKEGGVLEMDKDWSGWEYQYDWTDDKGVTYARYESTRDGRVTDIIVTQKDHKHTITFDNDHTDGVFTLVYDKTTTTTEPGHPITASQVKDDPTILDNITKKDGTPATKDDFIDIDDRPQACPDPDDPDRRPDSALDDVSKLTLPRQQLEVSRTSTVVDNTADQTSNIMSAAARVDLSQDVEADFDDSNDDDDLN